MEDEEKRMEWNNTSTDHYLVVPNIPPTFVFLINGFANYICICLYQYDFPHIYSPEMQSLTCPSYVSIMIKRYK